MKVIFRECRSDFFKNDTICINEIIMSWWTTEYCNLVDEDDTNDIYIQTGYISYNEIGCENEDDSCCEEPDCDDVCGG